MIGVDAEDRLGACSDEYANLIGSLSEEPRGPKGLAFLELLWDGQAFYATITPRQSATLTEMPMMYGRFITEKVVAAPGAA